MHGNHSIAARLTGLFLLVTATEVFAQGAPADSTQRWKLETDVKLTLNQASYSENWVGGEVGSLSWALNSNSRAERQLRPKLNSTSTLKLAFGQTHNQNPGGTDWVEPIKSTDLIDLENVERITLGSFVDPFFSLRFESQFLDGSDASNKRFINPMVFTETIGVARVMFKEKDREWVHRLGFGFRQRSDRDLRTDAGDPDKKETQTTNDGGVSFVSELKYPIAERLSWNSKLSLFKAVFFSDSDKFEGTPAEDYWREIDVNFENIFSADVTKYIGVSLYTQLLYDQELDLAGRFKQTLGVGFTYRLAGRR